MKREIKFRGLNSYSKEWFFGSYSKAFESHFIMPIAYFGTREFGDIDEEGNDIISEEIALGGFTKVDYETLGQFTGLKDRNGIDIYEGDILKTMTDKPMVVGWSEKFSSFILNRDGWAFSHWFGESCNPYDCEVIGNIHENPELL